MHCGLVVFTGLQLAVSTNNIVTSFCRAYFRSRIYRGKGSRFDENMKKYNEDGINYCVMCRLKPGLHIGCKVAKAHGCKHVFHLYLGIHIVVMMAGIRISQEIFTIGVLTALKPS